MSVQLLAVVIGYAFGVYFFYRGFLLTRHTLPLNSTCDEVHGASANASNCWGTARYSRAILLVVDALRYDFVAPQPTSNRVYHNKLTIVRSLLANSSQNSLLFRFVADPPTTTLQRLKALTTGSLPTFVDAGANFAGSVIDEDNLIDQFIRQGKKITFMGDDTWMSLFPGKFETAYPFPSFDVKDLDTVDRGIIAHLLPELHKTNWQLLIAHFLGVDHCGHTYGPCHPKMAQKLRQMNEVIRSVIDAMDDETVLFVLGDHGMTKTGDHGGESSDEVDTALFVYSRSLLHKETKNIRSAIAQIELVPTLALLLGVPVPFSNLGSVIPELFIDHDHALLAARANVFQVIRYTEAYLNNFHDALLSERFASLLKIFYSLYADELTIEKCLNIVARVGHIFATCWAKFHLGWMMLGILAVGETVLWSLVNIFGDTARQDGRTILLKTSVFGLFLWAVLARNESIPPIIGTLLGVTVALHVHTLLHLALNTEKLPSGIDVAVCVVFCVHCLSAFSNSYVVNEDSLSKFFCQTMFLLFSVDQCKFAWSRFTQQIQRRRRTQRRNRRALSQFIGLTVVFVVAVVLLKAGSFFRKCREEHVQCNISLFAQPFASLFEKPEKLQRIIVAVVGLSCVFFLPWYYMKKGGHLVEDSVMSALCELYVKCCTLLIGVFWLAQWVADEEGSGLIRTVVRMAPRFVYVLVITFVVSFLCSPLFVHILTLPSLASFPLGTQWNAVDLFKFLRSDWQALANGKRDRTAYISGFATAFSGSFMPLFWTISFFAQLVLGDGFSFSLASLLILLVLLADLTSDSLTSSPVLLSELCCHYFYAFGHQPCFTAIPWEAAFIGVPGNFAYYFVPAFLVIFHIGAGVILCVFAVPLQVFWKACQRKHFLPSYTTRNEVDYALLEHGVERDLSRFNVALLAALGTKMLFVMMASAVHRRHLMVWKIFAPKFVFEAALLLVGCISVLAQYTVALRIRHALYRFFNNLQ